MRKTFGKAGVVGVALLVVGCGMDFTGSYIGTLTNVIACPGEEPGVFVNENALVVIASSDAGFVWKTSDCGDIPLTESATSLSPKRTGCPASKKDGLTTTVVFKPSGTFTFEGSALRLALDSDLKFEKDGESVTCTSRLTGALVKSR